MVVLSDVCLFVCFRVRCEGTTSHHHHPLSPLPSIIPFTTHHHPTLPYTATHHLLTALSPRITTHNHTNTPYHHPHPPAPNTAHHSSHHPVLVTTHHHIHNSHHQLASLITPFTNHHQPSNSRISPITTTHDVPHNPSPSPRPYSHPPFPSLPFTTITLSPPINHPSLTVTIHHLTVASITIHQAPHHASIKHFKTSKRTSSIFIGSIPIYSAFQPRNHKAC